MEIELTEKDWRQVRKAAWFSGLTPEAYIIKAVELAIRQWLLGDLLSILTQLRDVADRPGTSAE